MRHSPGPWHHDGQHVRSGTKVVAQVHRWRVDISDRDAGLMMEANANLISAAPDLYDALLSLRAASSLAAKRLAARWADEALAKAQGEPPTATP